MTKLRLVPGGAAPLRVGAVPVLVTREAPADVDAVVVEDDRWLVLSADTSVREPGEHPVRTHTRAHETNARSPGDLVDMGGRPARWLAAVVDLEADVACDPAWVKRAVGEALAEAARRRVRAIALPLLGTRHGGLDEETAARATLAALAEPAEASFTVVLVHEDVERLAGWVRAGLTSSA